jgi:iron(III) transport system ATP-binding protein
MMKGAMLVAALTAAMVAPLWGQRRPYREPNSVTPSAYLGVDLQLGQAKGEFSNYVEVSGGIAGSFLYTPIPDGAFGLRVRGVGGREAQERVTDALALVRLEGLARRSPDQLSGGQQQRVAVARAVVTRPRVLLLDEPLSNLDAKLREQMRVELRRIQREVGITAIYVTHDQVEAMTLADRIVVLDRGRVQQVAPPAELYARPSNAFVAEFVGRVNLLEGRVVELRDGQCRVALRAMEAVVAAARPPAVGARVGVVVRPETVHLARDGALRGVVRRAVYLGSQVEYEVEVGGTLLQAIGRSPLEEGIFTEGEDVGVTIGFQVAHLLDLDGAPAF